MTKNPRSSEKVQRKIFFYLLNFTLPSDSFPKNFQDGRFLGPELWISWAQEKIFLGAQDPGPRIIFFLGTNIWPNPVEIIFLDIFPSRNYFPGYFFPVEIYFLDIFPRKKLFPGNRNPRILGIRFQNPGVSGPQEPRKFPGLPSLPSIN